MNAQVPPEDEDALFRRAVALHTRGELSDAAGLYTRVVERNPGHAEALHWLGVIRAQLDEPAEALALLDRAVQADPDCASAHADRGNVLRMLHRRREAVVAYDHALALQPQFAEALSNRGVVVNELGRPREALANHNLALALQPLNAASRLNRATALSALQRREEARDDLVWALNLRPDLGFARGALFHARMHCAEWRDHAAETARLVQLVRAGVLASDPFEFLGAPESARDQLACARIYVAAKYAPPRSVAAPRAPKPHARIRIAYVSPDFGEHPVSRLLSGVWTAHDRRAFEVLGISLCAHPHDQTYRTLQRRFDRFIEAQDRSDDEVATSLRDLEVDIAVDLGGFTSGARMGIFARRAAPIQVSYLGFPGTSGASYFDYVIADRTVVPEQSEPYCSEHVVLMPDTFQANAARPDVGPAPPRDEVGLPRNAFVFCCFNNNYKINPQMFDVWMRLLVRCEGSILWLLGGNASFDLNVRREARARDVDPSRLVLAPRLAYDAHLARLAQANLFLDTVPFNGGATASDALSAGVPVLTCAGDAFAARMAASLLHAIGLPELVTTSLADYEALAARLVSDRAMLQSLRERLARNRATQPLFDTARFTRHLEMAYRTMFDRWQHRAPPTRLVVAAGGAN